MNACTTLPDFSRAFGAGEIFAPFDAGAFAVLPTGATLAGPPDRPALTLALARRADEIGGDSEYSVLDMTIALQFRLDAALATARAVRGDAVVAPGKLDMGFARLTPIGADVGLPADMTAPTPLGWSSPEGVRWTQRLSPTTGAMIKSAILKGTLLFRARVEFTIVGVAPRVPATVDFAPADLLRAVRAGEGTVPTQTLVDRLGVALAGVSIAGDAPRAEIAQALADRLIAAFGSFAPAPGANDPPGFTFAGATSGMRAHWDLNTPVAAPRAHVLWLDPLGALGAVPDKSMLVHDTTIPALDLGFREIALAANLPKNRRGVAAIGARIEVAPAPPRRPDGVNADVAFAEPDDEARLTIRLRPEEALAYMLTSYAILAADGAVIQAEAAPRADTRSWLRLQASDFPVRFTHLSASDRLLKQAKISGALAYTRGGRKVVQPIALTQAEPDIALASPIDATDATLALKAVAPDGATIELPLTPSGVVQLDLSSFKTYGPHRVAIAVAFAGCEPPLLIDLVSERGANPVTIALHPAAPRAEWGYVCDTIFQGGYRYRPQGRAWSDPLDPNLPLLLDPGGDMQTSDAPGTGDPAPVSFDIDDVALTLTQVDPPVLSYVPVAPSAELDVARRPTLNLFKLGPGATLQLGAKFTLSEADEATLMAKVVARYPSYRAARLQPAFLHVEKAAVLLADASGALTEICASTTSAFPPYAAVFSANLDAQQQAWAGSAISGQRGVLLVEYTIVAPGAAAPTTRRADVATWFHGTEGMAHIRVIG